MSEKDISEIRFIADEMLGKLAKWLRTIGYDTTYYEEGNDIGLVQRALEEDRVILTRDTKLTERKLARKALLIKSNQTFEQLDQVVKELDLDVRSKLFTRCILCNTELVYIKRADARYSVPVYTYLTQDEFYRCPNCGRTYWSGTHKDDMLKKVAKLS